MKISQLIKLLEEEMKHGDCEVFVEGSNAIYLNPLPWYYDGGGDMKIGDNWFSTRFNKDLSGERILHICSETFNYGVDGECEYDGVNFPVIDNIETFVEDYEKAKERYYKLCRKYK